MTITVNGNTERKYEEIAWEGSATGERFPVKIDTDHPMWKTFLESSSQSPTHFFRSLLAPPTYFHSPTPWNATSRLAQKVSELLDSFKPGAYSYNPFKKGHCQQLTNEDRNIINAREEEPPPNRPRPPPLTPPPISTEDIRQRLYVDLGRPRPFVRRQSQGRTLNPRLTEFQLRQEINSLQELIKIGLLKRYGLENLHSMLMKERFMLPDPIRYQLFTYLCQDFEELDLYPEIVSGNLTESRNPASYRVRSIHDNRTYLAVFATSEVDKEVSNLWEDFGYWLKCDSPVVSRILALSADPLTQNVFFIAADHSLTLVKCLEEREENGLRENIESIIISLLECYALLKKHPDDGFLFNEHFLLLVEDRKRVILQNPLLLKKQRSKVKHVETHLENQFSSVVSKITKVPEDKVVDHARKYLLNKSSSSSSSSSSSAVFPVRVFLSKIYS